MGASPPTPATPATCGLCGAQAQLCQSHIVPKFCSNWAKHVGRQLITSLAPNRVIQDGDKTALLCRACEERLSAWESVVASEIFYPLHKDGETRLRYGPSLLKFLVSVSYRVGLYTNRLGLWAKKPPLDAQQKIDTAMAAWRAFLLQGTPRPAAYGHNLYLLSPDTANVLYESKSLGGYLDTVIDMRGPFPTDDGGIYTVTKMCRLLSIGTIVEGAQTKWIGTRIHANGGALADGAYGMPVWLLEHIRDVQRKRGDVKKQMSPRQLERMKPIGKLGRRPPK